MGFRRRGSIIKIRPLHAERPVPYFFSFPKQQRPSHGHGALQPNSLGLFLFHSYIFKGIPVSAVPFSEQGIAGLLHKMINSDANCCRNKCGNDQCQRNVGYKNLISPKCFLQDQKRGALHDIDGIGILSAESQYLSIQEENQT